MEYEALVRLAKAAAGLAVEARLLGVHSAAWDLVSACGALEEAAVRVREVVVEEDLGAEEAEEL